MSINMGAMLLLVAILSVSLAAAAQPSDNQDILMVVDKPLSPLADLEYGSFLLPDGKSLTLSRQRQRQPGKLGCNGPGEWCNLGTWCCGSLTCSDTTFGGTCSQVHSCTAAGGFCSLVDYNCCFPLRCNSPNGGICN